MEAGDDRKQGFMVVRPYPDRIRKRVFDFLESVGYEGVETVEAGTPDPDACGAVLAASFDLLLLPYHKHKASDGRWVNGFGVALELGDAFAERHVPILMPVDEFTWAASFERELGQLEAQAPRLAKRLVTLREKDIGEDHVVAALARAARA